MKKRIISVFLVLIILIGIVPSAFAAGSLDNFKRVNTYTQGQFADVSASSWYAGNVASAYELGLMKGSSKTQFNTDGNVTIAEAIAMAARLHCIYTTGTEHFSEGNPWYQVYIDYAVTSGIITQNQFSNYTSIATRLQFATIFSSALPDEALQSINTIEDGAIPDTNSAAVYKLYRAGILTGNDTRGTFTPDSSISRASASAIISRMAEADLRQSVTLKASTAQKTVLTAEEIYAQCSPAVFYIEVYNSKGAPIASGSGFFISSDGTAVTNFHVVKGSYSAKITLSDTGAVYDVLGVYDYNKDEDWAVLKINGSGFSCLDIGDTTSIVGGATVYAIGSPLGLQNTISQGLISNSSRIEGDLTYIQTSASISSGSSGGALINKYGEVIGITSASYVNGQNLNLALPLKYISGYSSSSYSTLLAIMESPNSKLIPYADYPEVLDCGAYHGVDLYKSTSDNSSTTYYYTYASLIKTVWQDGVNYSNYQGVLADCGFSKTGDYLEGSTYYYIYNMMTTSKSYELHFGVTIIDNQKCLFVKIITSQIAAATGFSLCPEAPDFGAFFGVKALASSDIYIGKTKFGSYYEYSLTSLTAKGYGSTFFTTYSALLEEWGFIYSDTDTGENGDIYTFQNKKLGYEISLSPQADNDIIYINIFYSIS
jgi:hypothetical protein